MYVCIYRLVNSIEADLRDVHNIINCNERDSEDQVKLYHAMRLENLELRQQTLKLQHQIEQLQIEVHYHGYYMQKFQ